MLLNILIFCPILAAILAMLGAPARAVALMAAVINLAVSARAFLGYDRAQAGYQYVFSMGILPDWHMGYVIGADGLSLVMLLLTAIVTLAAVWVTPPIERSENQFYASLLFISAGAMGAFASIDLFFFYAFHELALIPTFLLIGIWGSGDRHAAAWKITIYLALGSFVLLLGLIGLYQSFPLAVRTFDIRRLQELIANGQVHPANADRIYLLLLIGFGILISLFPFHTWAPRAYASAPAPAAMLHAGVLKKFGLYGLIRVALPLLPDAARHWTNLLLILLVGNIIYVGLVTISQKRLDLMLGYSSVMHMGYIFLGIASLNSLGLNGAALLMFAHGLSIAALFAIAGQVRRQTQTLTFEDLGGLAKPMPFLGFAFGLAAFASIGLPGFANFASEIMVFFGAYGSRSTGDSFSLQIATSLALWGVVISAVYMLRAYRAVFQGEIAKKWTSLTDAAFSLRLPISLLIAALLLGGFFPRVFLALLKPALRASAPLEHLS